MVNRLYSYFTQQSLTLRQLDKYMVTSLALMPTIKNFIKDFGVDQAYLLEHISQYKLEVC